jgi:hypothetical protein
MAPRMQEATAGEPIFCRTTLAYAPPPAPLGGPSGKVEVCIFNGRHCELPGWEVCGFELVRHTSAVQDWDADQEIASVHYPEAEALAKQLTGADAALVSDHVRRRAQPAPGSKDQAPVRLVHSDFAANYASVVRTSYRSVRGRGAAALARNGLSSADVEGARRLVVLQLWRNVGPVRMDFPMAFCDTRTVRSTEARPFRYTGYVAGGRAFDALAIVAPSDPGRHRWYAFPDMSSNEVVAFRTYDSRLVEQGSVFFTPHCAIPDPRVEPGRPARYSVELRVLCLFG